VEQLVQSVNGLDGRRVAETARRCSAFEIFMRDDDMKIGSDDIQTPPRLKKKVTNPLRHDSFELNVMRNSGSSFRNLTKLEHSHNLSSSSKIEETQSSKGHLKGIDAVSKIKITMSQLSSKAKENINRQIRKIQRKKAMKRWDLLRDFPEIRRGQYKWSVCQPGFFDALNRFKSDMIDSVIMFKREVLNLEAHDPNAVTDFHPFYKDAKHLLDEVEVIQSEIDSAYSFLCRQLMYDPKHPRHFYRSGNDLKASSNLPKQKVQELLRGEASFEDLFCIILEFIQNFDVAREKFLKDERKRQAERRVMLMKSRKGSRKKKKTN